MKRASTFKLYAFFLIFLKKYLNSSLKCVQVYMYLIFPISMTIAITEKCGILGNGGNHVLPSQVVVIKYEYLQIS